MADYVTIRKQQQAYRDSNGQYHSFDAVTDKKTSDRVADIETKYTACDTALTQRKTTILQEMPTYSTLSSEVVQLKSDIATLPVELGYESTGQVFNYRNATNNKAIKSADGTITDNESYWLTHKIETNGATKYICNRYIYKIAFYKSNNTFISQEGAVSNNVSHDIPQNTAYMIAQYAKENTSFENRSIVKVALGEQLPQTIQMYSNNGLKNVEHDLYQYMIDDFEKKSTLYNILKWIVGKSFNDTDGTQINSTNAQITDFFTVDNKYVTIRPLVGCQFKIAQYTSDKQYLRYCTTYTQDWCDVYFSSNRLYRIVARYVDQHDTNVFADKIINGECVEKSYKHGSFEKVSNWHQGSIVSSNGAMQCTTENRVCHEAIPIESYIRNVVVNGLMMTYVYDANGDMLGRMNTSWGNTSYTKDDILSAYPSASFVRTIFAYADGRNVTPQDAVDSGCYFEILADKTFDYVSNGLSISNAINCGFVSDGGEDSPSATSWWNTGLLDVRNHDYVKSNKKMYKIAFFDEHRVFISVNTSKLYKYDLNGCSYVKIQYDSNVVNYNNRDTVVINVDDDNYGFDGSVIANGTIGRNQLSDEIGSIIDVKNSADYYFGRQITIKNRFVRNRHLVTDIGAQSCSVFGNNLFVFGTNNNLEVYDMSTKGKIGTGTIDGGLSPHCNSTTFGGYYDSNDDFPLIYTNAYNTAGLPKGTCYVHRVTKSGNVYNTSLVQTITIGFTDASVWTSGSDVRPYGNFFVDTDKNILYAYTILDATHITRFFAFNLPNPSSGNITLQQSDIIGTFDTDYIAYPQDNCYNGGNVYICSGFGNSTAHGMLNVVDLTSKAIVSKIDFNSLGLQVEPQITDVYGDKLIVGWGAQVNLLTF